MQRLLFLGVCCLWLVDANAITAAELCLPPAHQVCVDSHDFDFSIDDRETCATHWYADEQQETLTSTVKVPQLNSAESSKMNQRTVKKRVCADAMVTRSHPYRSITFKPCQATIDVAFVQRKYCVDACGRCYTCLCQGAPTQVTLRDFHTRRFTRTSQHKIKTLQCQDIDDVQSFESKTIESSIADLETVVSTTGRKLTWTAKEKCVPTGHVTLTNRPAVHIVPVACVPLVPCPAPCATCCPVPVHGSSAARAIQSAVRPTAPPAPVAMPAAASAEPIPAAASPQPAPATPSEPPAAPESAPAAPQDLPAASPPA